MKHFVKFAEFMAALLFLLAVFQNCFKAQFPNYHNYTSWNYCNYRIIVIIIRLNISPVYIMIVLVLDSKTGSNLIAAACLCPLMSMSFILTFVIHFHMQEYP